MRASPSLLRGTAEVSRIHPRPRSRVKAQNSSRVGRWRRPARLSLLGGAALGCLVLRVSGAEVGESSSAASPSRGFPSFALGSLQPVLHQSSQWFSFCSRRPGQVAAQLMVCLRCGEDCELGLLWVATGTCSCSRVSAQRPDGAAPSSLGERIGVFFGVGRQVSGSQSHDPAARSACRSLADPSLLCSLALGAEVQRASTLLAGFHVYFYVCSSVRCVVDCSVSSLVSFGRSCSVALCNPGRLMALLIQSRAPLEPSF